MNWLLQKIPSSRVETVKVLNFKQTKRWHPKYDNDDDYEPSKQFAAFHLRHFACKLRDEKAKMKNDKRLKKRKTFNADEIKQSFAVFNLFAKYQIRSKKGTLNLAGSIN